MGQMFNRIVKAVVIDDFRDTQCGFKLFTGEVARSLFARARIDRFAYDVEILALAKKNGYRIAEVPIKWKNSTESKVRPVLDSLQMLADLVKIRMTVMHLKQESALTPIESLESLDSESANP
jgi:dolichyl-phosphate beta-glucosyltransferase